jgi:hypothetical protein
MTNVNAVLDCQDIADLIEGMARDIVLVRPNGREAWLREFRQSVGSEMPSEVVEELVARVLARLAEIVTGVAPTVH